MQLKQANIKNIRRRLVEVRELGRKYFTEIRPKQIPEGLEDPEDLEGLFHVEGWVMTKSKDYKRWENLSHSIKNLSIDIAAAARLSPLLSDADMQELRHNTRQMLANLKFRKYMYYGVFVHHDEGMVLGVDPPTHEETPLPTFSAAADYFDRAADKTLDIVDLLMANEGTDLATPGTANYEPNTAFIMMAIDSNKPDLKTSNLRSKTCLRILELTQRLSMTCNMKRPLRNEFFQKLKPGNFSSRTSHLSVQTCTTRLGTHMP